MLPVTASIFLAGTARCWPWRRHPLSSLLSRGPGRRRATKLAPPRSCSCEVPGAPGRARPAARGERVSHPGRRGTRSGTRCRIWWPRPARHAGSAQFARLQGPRPHTGRPGLPLPLERRGAGGHTRPGRELHLSSSFHCPRQLCIQQPVVSDNDPFKSQNQFLFNISGAPAAGWALSGHPKSTRRARRPAAL